MALSKYEIACVTAGVPATGDQVIDAIIRQGLRYKTAVEFMKNGPKDERGATDAIAAADRLLAAFTKKEPASG
jgi:hypothetical protein